MILVSLARVCGVLDAKSFNCRFARALSTSAVTSSNARGAQHLLLGFGFRRIDG